MKKTALFLVVMLVLSMFALSSCDLLEKIPGIENIPGLGDLVNKPCEEHVDANGDYICDKCEAELEKNDTPDTPCEHVDDNKDHKCDSCASEMGEHKAADGKHACDYCGAKVSEHEEADDSHNCSICGEKISECAAADKSHNCANCGTKLSECVDENKNYECDICFEMFYVNCEHVDADNDFACEKCGYVIFERVVYALDVADLPTGTPSEDLISGKFTILSGTEIRSRTKTWTNPDDSTDTRAFSKSIKYGSSENAVKISVPGEGTLVFWAQNGSSNAATQKVKLVAPDGKEQIIEFAGNDEGSPVVKLSVDVTSGEWTIYRGQGNTVDIYALKLECVVEVSPECGFELVSAGTVDYLVGDALDLSKIQLNSIYQSGKTDSLPIANVTIDSSAVNMAVSGTYPVVISYKNYETISFNVNVYAPKSIELGFDAVEKLKQNSSAGNGVYYNHSWKEVYLVGEELKTDGLSVGVIGICGDKTLKFRVEKYEITGFDSSAANIYELTISAYGVSEKIEIHITDAEPTPNEDGVYMLLVDSEYLGIAGILSGPYHAFRTIQSALDYAENIDKNAPKELYIAPGLYKEKLEITIPNLTIIGLGEKPEDVVIEWDSLYGLVDAGGFTHTTDSTQTVAVRESAYNCTMENITISNAYNSKAYFDEKLGENYPEHRALALLVMADKFVMKDSVLLGYQDTVELFTGRQYFKNVAIHGYTDFIFGTNNTTLFEDCVINTIYSGKSNGGYLTAFKGNNKNADDAIVYGAIFYHCKFTADEGVAEGLTAIGRPWGAYAAVAVIECELGGHIATTATGTASQNERYVVMSGVKPTDSTVQFVEYNNTGAGAITEVVAGMRFLTAEEAARYVDFTVIFGKTNGKVTYLSEWNPLSDGSSEPKVDIEAYHFDGKETPGATNHKYDQNIQGSVGTFGDMTIDATVGKLTARGSDSQFNKDAKISFAVKAGATVIVTSYPNYHKYTVNGVAVAEDVYTVTFDADATVEIVATDTAYLYSIIIQTPVKEIKYETHAYHFDGKETPEAINHKYDQNIQGSVGTFGDMTIDATVGKLTARGSDSQFNKDAKISFAVKAGSTVIITSYPNYHKYTINGTAATEDATTLEFAEDTTVEIVATDTAYLYSIIIISPVGEDAKPEEKPEVKQPVAYHFDGKETADATNHSFTGHFEGNSGTLGDMTIDATGGKFKYNEAGYTQMNANTKLTLEGLAAGSKVVVSSYYGFDFTVNGEAATAKVTEWTIGEDGKLEIVGTNTSYPTSIIIYPA